MNEVVARAAAEALVKSQWPEGTIASGMTCQEADAVAEFIIDVISPGAGLFFLQAHCLGDTDEGDKHAPMRPFTEQKGIGWGVDVDDLIYT